MIFLMDDLAVICGDVNPCGWIGSLLLPQDGAPIGEKTPILDELEPS